MDFGVILFGLLFLFNPIFSIIDVIPDFLGLLIVYFGLTRLSHINEDVRYARVNCLRLCAVSFLKVMSIGLVSGNDYTWYLLLAFTFGVIECILFYITLNSLFIGIERLGVKHNSDYVLSTYNVRRISLTKRKGLSIIRTKRDVITKVRSSSLVFYFARTVLSVLPEFTNVVGENSGINYVMFRPALHIICGFISLVWSVFYIVRLCRFFCGILGDKPFVSSLSDSHALFEKANPNYKTGSVMRVAMLMYALAVLLFLNTNEDGLSHIPLFLPAILLTAVAAVLSVFNKKSLFTLVFTVPLIPLSAYTFNLMCDFYTPTTKFLDIFHYETSLQKFTPISNLNLICCVLAVGAFIVVTRTFLSVLFSHISTASSPTGVSQERAELMKSEYREEFIRRTKIQKVVMYLTLGLTLVSTKLSLFFGALSAEVQYGRVDYPAFIYQVIVWVTFALCIAWLICSRETFAVVKRTAYALDYSEHDSARH